MFTAFLIALVFILAFSLLAKPQLPESQFHDSTFDLGSFRFGWSHHIIGDDNPYMERWILWIGVGTLRLHKFLRGDDERAPHDHPWAFVTFPFKTYTEIVFDPITAQSFYRDVQAFRFHYRPAKFQHIVKARGDGKPFWTFVISGRKTNEWGFWPWSPIVRKRIFIPWRQWT